MVDLARAFGPLNKLGCWLVDVVLATRFVEMTSVV